MTENIRKFALVIVDDLDVEIDRFNFEYVENPKNLGFELEFTQIELDFSSRVTSTNEKRQAVSFTIDFIPPNAYAKAKQFREFVLKHINDHTLLEYDDTVDVKYWEGKVQKFNQEELLDWGGLACSVSFLPTTPRFLRRNDTINVYRSDEGKSYTLAYSYDYGTTISENNSVVNKYFRDIPIRVYIYGKISNPRIGLVNFLESIPYTEVQFNNLNVAEGEHILIDALNSKILLWKRDRYISVYDYVDKSPELNTFLYASALTESSVVLNLTPQDTGYVRVSYRQYII